MSPYTISNIWQPWTGHMHSFLMCAEVNRCADTAKLRESCPKLVIQILKGNIVTGVVCSSQKRSESFNNFVKHMGKK